MDRKVFYDRVRASLFGGRLAQNAVDGMEALLASCARHRVSDVRHVADILTQVHHETGGYMLPIKETVYPSHKDKNPSDAEVKKRLDAAFAKGQLPWVKTPYWRNGWFGRGPIQITHEENYDKLGRRLGVDLVGNPALALDKDIGADIAVVGMVEGLFTGRKLSDYFSANKDDPAGSRRIVNGPDGNDAKIAANYAKFLAALQAAGFGEATAPIVITEPVVIQEPAPMPDPTPAPIGRNGGPVLEPEPVHTSLPTPVEQVSKVVGGVKWGAIATALWTAIVAADVLPAAFKTPEFTTAMTGVITLIAGAIGTYLAPKNAEPVK